MNAIFLYDFFPDYKVGQSKGKSYMACDIFTQQNNLWVTKYTFSLYANFDRVYGQNHRRYWNIVDCFLKWNLKTSASNNKIWNENFHFKIR